jgi:hypothetical protein
LGNTALWAERSTKDRSLWSRANTYLLDRLNLLNEETFFIYTLNVLQLKTFLKKKSFRFGKQYFSFFKEHHFEFIRRPFQNGLQTIMYSSKFEEHHMHMAINVQPVMGNGEISFGKKACSKMP